MGHYFTSEVATITIADWIKLVSIISRRDFRFADRVHLRRGEDQTRTTFFRANGIHSIHGALLATRRLRKLASAYIAMNG